MPKIKNKMKLFSFKKAVSFRDEHIVLEDLAYNHPYKKVDNLLIVEGKDKETNFEYTVYYTPKGQLKLVILKKKSHSVMMVSWKEEFDTYEIQKIKPNGDTFIVNKCYRTTHKEKHKLVSKTFRFFSPEKKESKKFTLRENKWTSEGNISPESRSLWLRTL